MNNSKESAYPTQCPNSPAGKIRGGLTKREYFAGLAMQALASNPDWAKTMRTPDDWDEYKYRLIIGSVELADELLKQLGKDE